MLPPLNALKAFDAVGRTLSIRLAAEELSVSHAAVSQHIRGLEAAVDHKLFDRTTQGLTLTPIGRSYHAQIAAAFTSLRQASETLKPEPTKVVVSVTPTFAAKWLIPNLSAFTNAHPDIDLRVLATERVSSFAQDGIDLAIRQGQPPFGAAFDATLLFHQEIVPVASAQLVEDGIVPITRDALASLPRIHDAHNLWPQYFRMMGLMDPKPRGLQVDQTALAIDAAVAHQGVALVSRFLVQRELTDGRLCLVRPEVLEGSKDFYVICPRRGRGAGSVSTTSTASTAASDAVRQWLCDAAAISGP